MTKPIGASALVTLFLSLYSGALGAAPPRQVLIFVSNAGCVDAGALASTVHRDTGLVVRVLSAPELTHPGDGAVDTSPDVYIEVQGADQALTIDIRGAGLHLSEPLQATRCERASEVAAAFVAATLAPPPRVALPDNRRVDAPPPPEKDENVAERAALMADDLDTEVRVADVAVWRRIVGAIGGAAFATGSFVQGAAYEMPNAYWYGAAGTVFSLGALATFVVDDDYQHTLLAGSQEMAGGLVVLGLSGTDNLAVSPYAVGATSGAFFVSSAFTFLGAAMQRPVSGAKLAADYRLVNSAEGRSSLTAEALARVEVDFRRTRSPLPRWLLAAPWLVGGAVTAGAAIADTRPSNTVRALEGAVGAAMLVGGMLALFPQGYDHYEKLLRENRLQALVGAGPGPGVSLVVQGRL